MLAQTIIKISNVITDAINEKNRLKIFVID